MAGFSARFPRHWRNAPLMGFERGKTHNLSYSTPHRDGLVNRVQRMSGGKSQQGTSPNGRTS
jgi:hypothetical protein